MGLRSVAGVKVDVNFDYLYFLAKKHFWNKLVKTFFFNQAVYFDTAGSSEE